MSKKSQSNRRTFLKTTGAVGAASVLPFSSTATAAESSILDDSFDLVDGLAHEALVVFDSHADVDRLGTLDLLEGFHTFEVLPIGYAILTTDQLQTVAGWAEVRYVRKNVELEYHNDDARAVTEVDQVQSDLGYTGDGVEVAVIDSGVDGDHPDLQSSLVANWRWAGNPLGEPTLWVRAGGVDTDDNGHGTHTSGTVAGDGTQSSGQFRGMAPDATLSVYSAGLTLLIVKAVAAYDHLLARKQEGATDIRVASNSYGSSNGSNFNPDDPLNVATWQAYQAGILSAFSAGNSGPGTGTLNQYAKGPHVLGVAATNDQKQVTDFSSRGRSPDFSGNGSTNYDRQTALQNLQEYHDTGSASGPVGLYRNGIGAPGNLIVSTMAPSDPLQAESADDLRLWYATISGTSMSCPAAAGIATLVVDAYESNNAGSLAPIDVLNTVEAEAQDVHSSYNPWNIGAGFVNALQSVSRAEAGNLATFSDVTLVSN